MIAEKASVCFCHQHKSFNFNQIFLKLADKVDMNQILTKLKKNGQIGFLELHQILIEIWIF